LLFVHWRVPVASIRDLIPTELEIDTYDGNAWIGLVPFYMSNVRPAYLPAVPWISNFCETNLRTYVYREDEKPGVWFFSLDAARLIPVLIARAKWSLNYFWSEMSLIRNGQRIDYHSHRKSKADSAATRIQAEVGTKFQPEDEPEHVDSLEFFLAERYLLYAKNGSQLLRGQVHHKPYPLHQATLANFSESITSQQGIQVSSSPNHVLFSEGVDVEIFPLEKI